MNDRYAFLKGKTVKEVRTLGDDKYPQGVVVEFTDGEKLAADIILLESDPADKNQPLAALLIVAR